MENNKLQTVLDAPGIKGKPVKTLPKTKTSLLDFAQTTVLNSHETNDPFYILDLGAVTELMNTWSRHLPMIQPFYAVKVNPNPSLLAALAALGSNFDCASQVEIQTVLSLGISPDRIIYANPCKSNTHLKYASNVGVNLTTFDTLYEIKKISKSHPRSNLLLRIKCPDDSAARWPLGSKFGSLPQEIEPLLRSAHASGLTISGVSFHIGSDSSNPEAYREAIKASRTVFDISDQLGLPPMSTLNIGGGFTAGTFFDEAAKVIKSAMKDYFWDKPEVTVIAEPGRYFAETAFTLATSIIGKRVRDGVRQYWLNDGAYGSFLCIAYMGVAHPPCVPLAICSNPANLTCEGLPAYKSTLFGPTCDSTDKVEDGKMLPELEADDWLLFFNMGAYTTSCATSFNGFSTDVMSTYLIFSYECYFADNM